MPPEREICVNAEAAQQSVSAAGQPGPLVWAARKVVLYTVRLPIRVGLRLGCQARVVGEERVPRTGALIVAANHTSFADPVVLQALFPRFLTYLMTERFYHVPLLHGFFRFWGVLRVKAAGLNRDALRGAAAELAREGAVGIFPEGGISRDGRIHDALPGIALLAQRTGAPILPVGLAGVGTMLPPDTWRLRAARVAMVIGQPFAPAGLGRRELLERVNRELRAIAERAQGETGAAS